MFAALLDTSVLWPSTQRDFLLSLAVEGLYRPLWSPVILEELREAEERKWLKWKAAPTDAAQRGLHLIGEIRRAFDDAEVTGWEPLEGTFGLPDPNDEHVVAAALLGGAGTIVTSNAKDFPREKVPGHIEVLSPAEFAVSTVAIDPVSARRALDEMAARRGRNGPAQTPYEVLWVLASRYGMRDVALMLRTTAEESERPLL